MMINSAIVDRINSAAMDYGSLVSVVSGIVVSFAGSIQWWMEQLLMAFALLLTPSFALGSLSVQGSALAS